MNASFGFITEIVEELIYDDDMQAPSVRYAILCDCRYQIGQQFLVV